MTHHTKSGKNTREEMSLLVLFGKTFRNFGASLMFFLGFLTLVLAFLGERGLIQVFRLRQQALSMEKGIASLEAENLELRKKILDLRYNPEAIERIAREQLGFARADEFVFLFGSP